MMMMIVRKSGRQSWSIQEGPCSAPEPPLIANLEDMISLLHHALVVKVVGVNIQLTGKNSAKDGRLLSVISLALKIKSLFTAQCTKCLQTALHIE